MAPVRQSSFGAGELAPALWGRAELASYAQGLRRLRNFYVTRQGAALSRPGTRLVASSIGTADTRLVPFVYSDAQSYVLEVGLEGGSGYVRFISGGALVTAINPSNGMPVPYQVALPALTTAAQLQQLKWAQSGDVVTFCAPAMAPFELRRNSHNSWAVAALSFDRAVIGPIVGGLVLRSPLPTVAEGYPDTRQPREWQWAVTLLQTSEAGVEYESAPFVLTHSLAAGSSTAVALPEKVLVTPTDPVTVVLYNPAGLAAGVVRHRIYRGRGRMFGWVGDSDTWFFTDTGVEPDYARQPPKGENPFKVYNEATTPKTLLRTEYPRAVCFFEERRVFGGTAERPGFLFFSATGDYANFDQQLLPVASDAAIYELAARRREEVRALVPLEKLLVLTNASVWSFAGSQGYVSPVESSPPVAKVHLEVGTTWLEPLVLPGAVLMSRAKGTGVRDLAADFQQASYQGGDVSLQASHLFEGYTLRDWCWAEDPHGVVWAVRNDGKLLSLTYDRERQVQAWGLNTLPDGTTDAAALAVCSVPEGNEDAVYLLVQRTAGGETVRYLERFGSRVGATWALDCSTSVTIPGAGPAAGDPQDTFSGLSYLNGKTVYAVGDGIVYGPYTVSGGTVTLPVAVRSFHVGLLFTCELEALDVALDVRSRQKTVSSVFFEVETRGALALGETSARLTSWTPPAAFTVGEPDVARVHVQGSWGYKGRALLRTTQPRPCVVYALTREVEVGGP